MENLKKKKEKMEERMNDNETCVKKHVKESAPGLPTWSPTVVLPGPEAA